MEIGAVKIIIIIIIVEIIVKVDLVIPIFNCHFWRVNTQILKLLEAISALLLKAFWYSLRIRVHYRILIKSFFHILEEIS